MRFLFLFLLFFLNFNGLFAQNIKGRTVNYNDAAPLSGVVIQNLNSAAFHSVSDNDGYYEINASMDDSIRFTMLGFIPKIVIYNGFNEGWFSWVAMQLQSFVIDTVVVRNQLTQYQKDSMERRGIYGRKVDEKPAKFRLSRTHPVYQGGGKGMVSFDAPLSAPLQRISKKYKRLKHFQDRFKADENQIFIDSRYAPALVTEMTNLKNDSLLLFIQTYPMSYSFARAASDLEIKMWILYNYKLWMKPLDERKP